MKKIFAIMSAAAMIAVAGCQKALDKSDVEKGFKGSAPAPTATISECEAVGNDGFIQVKVEFGNFDPEDKVLDLGILYSSDEQFNGANYTRVKASDVAEDGTATVIVENTVDNAEIYLRAYIQSFGGTCYSEVASVDIPRLWAPAGSAKFFSDWMETFDTYGTADEEYANVPVVKNLFETGRFRLNNPYYYANTAAGYTCFPGEGLNFYVNADGSAKALAPEGEQAVLIDTGEPTKYNSNIYFYHIVGTHTFSSTGNVYNITGMQLIYYQGSLTQYTSGEKIIFVWDMPTE